ncbi:MAG: excinuclease ABC subunit UvrA [bacterium]|nr:excinuclease ABC subunit UvrA [bacterium]
MNSNSIIIKGARQHNLKNIDLEIPRDKLVVITGLSGSGKSSLAFDTIYAEGQRRYVESLSSYARQFLEQMDKPDVDYIGGLSPAISIEQRTSARNPRSTVGTVTEIYDYLRVLFARIGEVYCYKCGRKIAHQTSQQIVDSIMKFPQSSKIMLMSPIVRGRKGEYNALFEDIRKKGFVRLRVDGNIYNVEDEIKLNKNKKHNIEVVVDRLAIKSDIKSRLSDSVETALKLGEGLILVCINNKKDILFSEHFACIKCGINYSEFTPRMFSFNSPYGACKTCNGLGRKMEVDPDLIVPDMNLSINEGAIISWSNPITTKRHRWKAATRRYLFQMLETVSDHYNIDLDIPFKNLSKEHQNMILYGTEEKLDFTLRLRRRIHRHRMKFEGVINNLERRWSQTDSEYVKSEIYNKYMRVRLCPECEGARLSPQSLAVRINKKSIAKICSLSIKSAIRFFNNLRLGKTEEVIAHDILKEVRERLTFLSNVGLDYITLDRTAQTLSGGEGERIRLATQIGSGLVGVLYILDEPSIGLHQRDNRKLLKTLTSLRDLGNTVIVVEHDEQTIRNADYVIDLGPGAGIHGGDLVACGRPEEIIKNRNSITGKYLSGEIKIGTPEQRRRPTEKQLRILGAFEHNLKKINVNIPLGLLVCVSGVSGSGKSTLVDEILYRALAQILYGSKEKPGKHVDIKGFSQIDKVANITQAPIGRTPRSNPATYTGAFDYIRRLFSQVPGSRARGYKPGRFSFNVKGGRCETCKGDGLKKIEMHFLPDIYVTCETCRGTRFNRETLEIKYKDKSIADVLDMTIEEALKLFENIPPVKRKLQTLNDVGLGYIKLGQSATTLSGGEAQRVKLASELSKVSTGRTLYILDEPTTGLHFADVQKLLDVLGRLVDKGNTVLIIEHNLDVLKTADYIIDLGPEGGDNGGEVVAEGTPEQVAKNKRSYTGKFLKKVLEC